jgi:glycosyltransferase involved in cell wall biosynthesis
MTTVAGSPNDLVSVIIPSCNKGPFLAEAIDSVLEQTYTPLEVIVVDDGSTDDTPDVARRDPGIRYLRQKNSGVSAARNAGLHASKGTYMIFLDADDRLLPHAVAAGVDSLEAHPECVFASGHVQLISADAAFVSAPKDPCVREEHFKVFLTHNYIWTPSAVIFRASVVRAVAGYATSRSGAADWELYLRISRTLPVHCHDQVVVQYRRMEGAMSSDAAKMLKDSLAALHAQRAHIKGETDLVRAYKQGVRAA